MNRWIKISSFASCLLALAGLEAGLEAQSTFSADKGEKRLAVFTSDEYCDETQSTTFVPIFNSFPIKIPAGWTSGRIVARFQAMSHCGHGSSYCSVQLLVNGVPMAPASGFDYAFDSQPGPETGYESNSVERTSGELGPGTYTIEVQGGVVGSAHLTFCGPILTATLWRVR